MTGAPLVIDNGYDFQTATTSSPAGVAAGTSPWAKLRAGKVLLAGNERFYRFQACSHAVQKRAHGVGVYVKGAKSWVSGVMRCGSVWICPVCAPRVAGLRGLEVQIAIDNAIRRGWGVSMVTLTFSHGIDDQLANSLKKFTKAQDFFKSGNAAASLRKRWGFRGEIKTLEVTHGQNGWHPHTHGIWFTDTQLHVVERAHLQNELFDLWLSCCIKAGLPKPNREHGVDVRGAKYAADYVAKWGFATEITGQNVKKGKKGRTPWQLLNDAASGDGRSAWLWREFAECFFSKRQLVWSRRKTGEKIKKPNWERDEVTGHMNLNGYRLSDVYIGLREELGLAPELTEQELLDLDDEQEKKRQVIVLDLDTWSLVRATEQQEKLLDLARVGNRELLDWLNGLRCTQPMVDGRICGPRDDWMH